MRPRTEKLYVVIADDERPARSFLSMALRRFADVEVVGEAVNGMEAVALIEEKQPDLALLDLQMPEVDGFGVVRLLKKNHLPMIAFVTAHDEYAIRAFEVNAIDYILKPVEPSRLRRTIDRAIHRLEQENDRSAGKEKTRIRSAAIDYEREHRKPLQRIPIRLRNEIILLPIEQLVSIEAEGELMHLTTTAKERHTMSYRLKDLVAQLDPHNFVQLGRGAVVNVDMIRRIVPSSGGTYTIVLYDDRELPVSRIQSRILREKFFRL